MTTFALVHGAFHGAWCWDLLVAELTARGHATAVPELPSEDPTAGVDRYADIVVDTLSGIDDDVVVVGHSLGCLTIPVVAERRPVALLAYLAGPVPAPGRTVAEAMAFLGPRQPGRIGTDAITAPDGTHSIPFDAAIEAFYHDCDPELAAWAASRLRRQSWLPIIEPSPLHAVPTAPAAYIACEDDRTLAPERQYRTAREMLGVEAIVVAGSHSPMLSRPSDLAAVLVDASASPGQPA